MRLNRIFIAISFALSPFILNAQEISIGNNEDQPLEERIIYSNETTLHATIHSRGLGGVFKIGHIRSIHKTTNWDFEISYLRSQKQIKLLGNLFSISAFVYGKLNDVLVLRGGYEVEKRIYGKPYWGGVELRWLYEFGGSIALLKPYYYAVNVAAPSSTGGYVQALEYQTFENQSQWIDIIGKAPFKYGLNEIKVQPGIFAKGGMNFEIGTSKTRAQSIEFGVVAEYYPLGLPLMADNPKEHIIPALYLSYNWGSRYNKY